MAILRRRGPTGVIQRIPVGRNFQADCVFGCEGLAAGRSDSVSRSENLAGLLSDRFIRQEFLVSLTRDSVPPIEKLLATRAEFFDPAEFVGSTSVTSDVF